MPNDQTSDTAEWLNKLHDTQAKDERNRRIQGEGHPERQLVSKKKRNGR